MQMTSDEIVYEYRHALYPKDQIRILAELNDCKLSEIVTILTEAGEPLSKRSKPHAKAQELLSDDQFLTLYKKGYGDRQIARMLGVSHDPIRKRRLKLELPPNKAPISKRKKGE